MTTEVIDKLYLELSQISQAKTAKELTLKDTCDCLTDEIHQLQEMLKAANDVLRSCYAVCERQITSPTQSTNWESLLAVVKRTLEEQHKYFYPKPDERNA